VGKFPDMTEEEEEGMLINIVGANAAVPAASGLAS